MFDRSHEVSASTTSSSIPTIRTPLDLQDAFDEACHAPRALSALIKTARLSQFSSGECSTGSLADQIADDLQFGLSKLIDLCIDSQTSIIESYVAQYRDSDENLLEEAEHKIRRAKDGFFTGSTLQKELCEAERLCETVIGRNGYLVDRAEAILHRLLNEELYKCVVPSKRRENQPAPSADPRSEEVAQ
jgi:hypothetical protein